MRHKSVILAVFAVAISLISQLTAGASPSPGSANQVATAVKAATSRTTIPSNLTPPLSSFGTSNGVYEESGLAFFNSCDPYNYKNLVAHPKPCLFGDLQSKKTIVLVGDSVVGNWAPALAIGLKRKGYRLAVFGFIGCPTPFLQYSAARGSTGAPPEECDQWHALIPAAVRALHPIAVISVSGPADLDHTSDSELAAGFKKLFTELTAGSPSAARIIFGTSPLFTEAVPECLAAHRNPKTCAVEYLTGQGYYGGYLARDPKNAAAASATLVPTYQWFCSKGTCPPIIGSFLAFADTDHLTLAFSEYLSTVATDAVLQALGSH